MTPAKWVNFALVAQYLLLTVLYAFDADWPRSLYWFGAAVIAVSVLML